MSTTDNAAATSYDLIARARTGDMKSKDTPFRHFNNHVKKALVQFALDSIKESKPSTSPVGVSVLDLASGRGGDLGKWLYMESSAPSTVARHSSASRWGRGPVTPAPCAADSGFATRAQPAPPLIGSGVTKMTKYTCYDISPECIAEAHRRYEAMAKPGMCTATFKVVDCFSDEFMAALRAQPDLYDVVSIQFSFHYACSTSGKVSQLVESIAASLTPGGVVIITTVDPAELSRRAAQGHFGNGLYSVELLDTDLSASDKEGQNTSSSADDSDEPLLPTGTAYHFKLKGFVDCVEYIVPLREVRACAAACGLSECEAVSKPFSLFLRDYEKDWNKNHGNILNHEDQELTTLYRSVVFKKTT